MDFTVYHIPEPKQIREMNTKLGIIPEKLNYTIATYYYACVTTVIKSRSVRLVGNVALTVRLSVGRRIILKSIKKNELVILVQTGSILLRIRANGGLL
jgi:hypothetical protein